MALFAATTVLTGLTSCAEKDLPASTSEIQMRQDLVGSWISEYSQKGMATMANGHQRYGISAVQALTFNADGTGTCAKYICDVAGEPFSRFGDAANGKFHYAIGKDSVITLTRDGDGNASNPKTWKLTFGANGLKGTDGTTEYEMISATEGWKAYIGRLEKVYNKKFRGKLQASGRDTTFLTDWETYREIELSGLKEGQAQYLPWAGSADSDISDDIRFDIQKAAGWEMAFCVVNDPQALNTRIFGLYNRYTGTLRVFHYVLEPGLHGYGKEVGYSFISDGDAFLPRYPLYNSMEYAIPVSHNYSDNKTFNRTAIVESPTGIKHRAFETMYSAFTRATTPKATQAGWHCVDFDLSGYTPEGVHWTQGSDDNKEKTLLSIAPYSSTEEQVMLTGSIVGKLAGEFKDPEYMQHTSGSATYSKVAKTVSGVASLSNGILSNIAGSYASANQIASLNANHAIPFYGIGQREMRAFYGINGTLTGVSTVMNILDMYIGEHVDSTTLKNPGTINLNLDAKVNLDGTITKWNSVSDAGVRINTNLLQEAKNYAESQWIGSGCIGLAEDPVVYVSQEDLLSVSPSISISKDGNNYKAPSFRNDSVRLVSFLDPRTVKLCLNTDLYHDIDSVHLIINYGVNINRPVGNTDDYRRMLLLDERPTFSIMPNSGYKLTTATRPKLTVMKKSTVIQNDVYTQLIPDSVRLDYQSDFTKSTSIVLPMYGHYDSEFGRQWVTDPQVFVPFDQTEGSSTVYPVTIPDFVVSVSVLFKCKECPGGVGFNQVYIPKVKLIKHADLAGFYDDLKAYSDKTEKKEAIGTLYNDNKVKVYHNFGRNMLAKTLDVLEACIE